MTSLLRPRLAAIAAAPRCIRCFSASRARRSGLFTVSIPPASSKQSVLDDLLSRRDDLLAHNTAPAASLPDNAAVVLASPEFATWLEDEAFMAGLLQGLPLADDASSSPDGVRVLAAVVAALAPPPPTAQPKAQTTEQTTLAGLSGLSVAYGNKDRLLPFMARPDRVNKTALRGSRGSIGSDIDKDAAITVQVPPLDPSSPSSPSLPSSPAPLRVTLPLANTIFQNGRRSTLLASSWHADPASRCLRRTAVDAHEHDLVVPPISESSSSSSSTVSITCPLFPIAEPLTIAAGLGNIVRQVLDAQAKPIPAARELEAAIPALLAARKRSDPARQDAAMGVWALVVPAALVPFYRQLKQQVRPALDALSNDADKAKHTADVEQHAAALASEHFTTLLAAGCRLHKVLSGGGGWGLKQGLLSLDPQMSHPAAVVPAAGAHTSSILGEERGSDESETDDDEAMLSFIRSFKSETAVGTEPGSGTADAVDGVAMPGAVVQFFVAPLESSSSSSSTETAVGPPAPPTHSITLGSQAGDDGSLSAAEASSASVGFYYNHFGAVSNHGIFLASSDGAPSSPAIRTKLDAPDSYVSCTVLGRQD